MAVSGGWGVDVVVMDMYEVLCVGTRMKAGRDRTEDGWMDG
jgi:hypothetical protein